MGRGEESEEPKTKQRAHESAVSEKPKKSEEGKRKIIHLKHRGPASYKNPPEGEPQMGEGRESLQEAFCCWPKAGTNATQENAKGG